MPSNRAKLTHILAGISNMPTRGCCYVANTSGYVDEAMNSLASLRVHMPDISVAVIAPPDLFRSGVMVDHWVPLPAGRTGPIVKTAARLAPYDQVLFLDTDTYIAGDISDVFSVLDAFDLALGHEPTRGWDYETDAAKAFCELNTGVIAFRKDEKVEAFFNRWELMYEKMKKEQPSFRTALWMSAEIRHATLPSEYHFICAKGMAVAWEAKLLHDRGDLSSFASIINSDTGPRVFVPGWGLIHSYRGRRLWIRNYLRLTANFLRVLANPRSLCPKKSPVDWLKAEGDGHNFGN
jgi:hypothetical protein